MRTKLLTALTAVVAATAVAAPAHAQLISEPGPQIDAGACKVRSSHDEGQRFTYADCEVTVNGVPAGQSVKVRYKSNLKTFKPHAEFGPWDSTTGTITAGNQGAPAGTTDDIVVGLQLAFPGKSVAQVKKDLTVTLSSATPGATVTDATATPSR
ncbi:hypothetical protein DVA67_027925 [Solirubrobacter sp. CPCC 204708]|uniref:Uncharacterized protein n=1 Tax=Solirubrobacter deserti TaxID=2282478 RepID=A0ABT4RJG7_9ACTN|nr:hypothetical protein [Solirubrobacter deserti]MBE2319825.1 hypothetical protein [Solirubrobacter deserti]MDA0138694.1 hypothetical protein [Solirubrobacter deserti]